MTREEEILTACDLEKQIEKLKLFIVDHSLHSRLRLRISLIVCFTGRDNEFRQKLLKGRILDAKGKRIYSKLCKEYDASFNQYSLMLRGKAVE